MNIQTKTTHYKLIYKTIMKVKIEKMDKFWSQFFLEKDVHLCKIKYSFVVTKTCISGYQIHQQ